jgi:hypothetical protein
VIAAKAGGGRLAVEYTRILALENHQFLEELLQPIAQALEEVPRLDCPTGPVPSVPIRIVWTRRSPCMATRVGEALLA